MTEKLIRLQNYALTHLTTSHIKQFAGHTVERLKTSGSRASALGGAARRIRSFASSSASGQHQRYSEARSSDILARLRAGVSVNDELLKNPEPLFRALCVALRDQYNQRPELVPTMKIPHDDREARLYSAPGKADWKLTKKDDVYTLKISTEKDLASLAAWDRDGQWPGVSFGDGSTHRQTFVIELHKGRDGILQISKFTGRDAVKAFTPDGVRYAPQTGLRDRTVQRFMREVPN